MGQLNFRVPDDTRARWVAAAADAGEKLSEFVRVAVEDRIRRGTYAPGPETTSGPAVPPATTNDDPPSGPGAAAESGASGRASTTPRLKRRAAPCEHRVPPGSHCSRGCD